MLTSARRLCRTTSALPAIRIIGRHTTTRRCRCLVARNRPTADWVRCRRMTLVMVLRRAGVRVWMVHRRRRTTRLQLGGLQSTCRCDVIWLTFRSMPSSNSFRPTIRSATAVASRRRWCLLRPRFTELFRCLLAVSDARLPHQHDLHKSSLC